MAKEIRPIAWENLAKQLQEALAREMKEVERLQGEIERLNNQLESYVDEGFGDFLERKRKDQVIEYLERRLFEEMKKSEPKEKVPF